jgi:hypothetical protein
MAHTNVHIPTSSDVRSEQYRHATDKERDFWLKKAEDFHNELENIFDAVKQYSYVELDHRGEKITLRADAAPAD